MTSRPDRIREFHTKYGYLPYYSGGGDVNRNNIPDRADPAAGVGLDCSGDVTAACRFAWAPDPAPFPLISTSSLALIASEHGWFVPLGDFQECDVLLHATNGDIFHSDGPIGHTEFFDRVLPDGQWLCMGSSGSGDGVGWKIRRPDFWQARVRIPGMHDHSAPVITPEQLLAFARALEELDVEHGMAVDMVLNPDNTAQGYTLDRWGGIHAFGGAPRAGAIDGGGWPGRDVARRIVVSDWSKPAGHVMDLDGATHSFGGVAKLVGTPYWRNGKIVEINEV